MFDFFMFYMWLTLFFVLAALIGFLLSVFSESKEKNTNKSSKATLKKAKN